MIKRIILSAIFVLLIAGVGLCREQPIRVQNVTASDTTTTAILVPSLEYKFTSPISIANADSIGVMYRVQTASTGNVHISFEQGPALPATAGTPYPEYLNTDLIDADATYNARWQLATVSTVILPYGRFEVHGIGSNAANTTVEIKVSK